MKQLQGRRAGLIALGLMLAAMGTVLAAEPPGNDGLRAPALEPLPLGEIKPAGWLKTQLEIQAQGLSGHLDEYWPDIKDSAWIGGKAEGWERVPYWLDGVVPLAYLNDDPNLKAKIKRFIDYILDHQRADGWLGPIGDVQGHQPYDPWPLFPMFKALLQYEQATGDERVMPALVKCARRIGQELDKTPLYSWGKMRAADFAVALYALHDRVSEPWLLDLARKAFEQSHDWRAQFEDFKDTGKSTRIDLDIHGVNIAMALKYGPVRYRLTGDPKDRDAIFLMLQKLDQYHGQPNGMYSCDEHLAGRSPSQGSELCAVVEAMYSLETALAITGDARLGDRLEKIAFNALPATFKKDMTAHQYDQQCNQVIAAREGEHVYTSNGPEANLYGLEPNFGCCTANLHQGWPKFVSNLWMKTPEGGLAVAAYAPCVVETKIQGKPVKLEVKTDYPFRDSIEIVVTVPEPMTFPLSFRVPKGTARPSQLPLDLRMDIPGRRTHPAARDGFFTVEADWSGTKTVWVRPPRTPMLYRGANGSAALTLGPLVFALPIEPEWRKLRDQPMFADWEVYPRSPWNYALEIDPAKLDAIEVRETPIGDDFAPFSAEGDSPVALKVKGRRLEGWTLEKNAAQPPPESPVTSDAPLEELTLIPYGRTDLRITEFPILAVPTPR